MILIPYTVVHWNIMQEVFGDLCPYCDLPYDRGPYTKKIKEHIIPVSRGGKFVLQNIIPACSKCNSYKAHSDIREWLNDEMRYEAILMTMSDIEYLIKQSPASKQ